MKTLLQRAINTKAHNSMYIMLTISIAMFFVYTGLVSNSQMNSVMSSIEYTLPIWMTALICILAVFSFVYYHYLCAYTLDEKMKDYGILVSMGYNQKRISEDFLRIIAKSMVRALLYGLLAGTLIYFILLNSLNRVLNTDFHTFPLWGYILVGAVYTAVYLINAVSLRNRINGLEISDMLNYKRLDKSIECPVLYQNIGFALLAFGLLLLTFKGESYNFASALFPMLFLTASAYCLTMSFSHWFTKIFVRSTSKYHRNLFYISQLRTNYKKYAKLLTGCTIIVIFGLFMLIIDVSLATDDGDHSFEMPYDFTVYMDAVDGDALKRIEDFETQESALLTDTRLVRISDGAIQWEGEEFNRLVHVMPESSYFELTGKHLGLENGGIVVLSQIDRSHYDIGTQEENGVRWGFQPPGPVPFLVGDKVYTRTIVKEIWEVVYNIEDQAQRTYIIADEDYEGIVSEAAYDQMKYFISVSSPDSLSTVYHRLQEISPIIAAKEEKLETQAQNKLVVSILILLAVMLLLFSLLSLILLRINQNISEEKRKYSNLFIIGYTYVQLQGEIRKEMATLFFVPIVLGSFISIMYALLANTRTSLRQVIVTFGVALLFFAAQYIFYRVAAKALARQYLN
ncbi:MAG: ABC transporter permease [Lachnospiraceae bacterium]|nr:ABC transporter permease [Lachnospiraceae bacterium]